MTKLLAAVVLSATDAKVFCEVIARASGIAPPKVITPAMASDIVTRFHGMPPYELGTCTLTACVVSSDHEWLTVRRVMLATYLEDADSIVDLDNLRADAHAMAAHVISFRQSIADSPRAKAVFS